MRVLQVINSLELAGAEVLVADLVPRLRQRGVRVSVALLTRTDTRLERALLEVSGCEVFGQRRNVRSPEHVFWLAKLFPTFDVVHTHLFPAQLWSALAARTSAGSMRMVTTEHGSSNNRRTNQMWRSLDRWIYAQFDKIVCNSPATADSLHQWVPCTKTRTTIIPNGVDLSRFNRGSTAERNAAPLLTAVCVARLDPQKDHMTLLRALKEVPGVRLKLVGDGSLRNELARFAAESGIEDRVEFLGRRDDVPEILAAADIYVHSTHFEGFAISVVEAMAAGLPVVATNVPGISWVAGDVALLSAPGSATELSAHLRRLVHDAGLRRDLGERGKRRAREFSIDATVDGHIQLYESLTVSPEQVEVRIPTR